MPRPRSDIRQRIVRSARKAFLATGVDGASLRTIARGARTSIGMIYYYFPSKDDLFLAVVEEIYVPFLADLEVALADDAPSRERLRRMFTRIGAVDDEELATLRLIGREALSSSERLDRIVDRFRRGHVPLVIRAVMDGFADGSIAPERHPGLVFFAAMGIGFLPQLISRVLGPRLPFPGMPAGAAMSAELVDVLFGGVSGRPGGG